MSSLWQEIGDFCYPTVSHFTRYFESGEKRRRQIYDSTAESALDIAAAGILGLAANPTTKYIGFKAPKELEDDREIKEHIEEATDFVLSVFNDSRSGFQHNLLKAIKCELAFGTVPFMIDSDDEIVAKFRADSPRGLNFTCDFQGNPDQIFLDRGITVSALQDKVENSGWKIPADILRRPDNDKIVILRHIYKNPKYNPEKDGKLGARFLSDYYLKKEKKKIHSGFFYTNPVAIGRLELLDDEKWGDSRGRILLSDIKMVNFAEKSIISNVNKELSPAWAIAAEAKLSKLNISSNAYNVVRGLPRDAIQKLETGGDINLPMQWAELKREVIRKGFYNDLFQMIDASGMQNINNGVAFLFNQERLRVLAPKVMRIQNEIIGVAAERVYDLAVRSGKLEVPESLAGQELTVSYSSPVMVAQQSDEANQVMQFLTDINSIAAAIGQVSPEKAQEMIMRVDYDEVANILSESRGVPVTMLRPMKEVEAEREANQQQQQVQAGMEMAQQAGEVAQTFGGLDGQGA